MFSDAIFGLTEVHGLFGIIVFDFSWLLKQNQATHYKRMTVSSWQVSSHECLFVIFSLPNRPFTVEIICFHFCLGGKVNLNQ